jgi:hypothetical protein
MQALQALQNKIDSLRQELDDYIENRCNVIASGTPGVPAVNIRMMLTARSGCHCSIAAKILRDQAVALELEKKHNEGLRA